TTFYHRYITFDIIRYFPSKNLNFLISYLHKRTGNSLSISLNCASYYVDIPQKVVVKKFYSISFSATNKSLLARSRRLSLNEKTPNIWFTSNPDSTNNCLYTAIGNVRW